MRLILFTFFFLSASIVALAQYSISGTVSDSTQQPVMAATLYIPDLKKGTVTDEQGKFTLTDIPQGKFLLEARSVGYATLVQPVDVRESVRLDLTLSPTMTELNEIVISGVSHSTELKKNPVSIATLSGESLVRNNALNIIDNITQKAGVYQITTGAAISKPVIRGLGYNRIITLYDGIRQEGQQWGDEHGIEVDEFSVDRVEIIKGAGSLMYGSDGIGGVLNLLAPNPVAEGTTQAKWTSNFQSNNGLISNSLSAAGNVRGRYWSLLGSEKLAKDYKNAYDGRVFNSGFRELDFSGIAGINKSWGYSQFTASSFSQQIGLVEGDRDAQGKFTRLANIGGAETEITAPDHELNSYSLFVPRQSVHHVRFSNTTNVYRGNSRLRFNAGYQRNFRREFGDVLTENDPTLFFDLATANSNLILYLPEVEGWNFSIGASSMWQQNRNRGVEFLIPEYQLFDWGIVTFAKKSFDRLDVAGGIRFDQRHIRVSPLFLDQQGRPTGDGSAYQKFGSANVSFSNYSASAGIAYQFTDYFSLKANASRGFRAPNIAELASNGRHEGSLRYEYGNYNLKAETSLQTDMSLLLNSPHVSAEVSVYQNTIDHYIFTEKLLARNGTDSIADPSEPVPAYQYTQGKAHLTGGEFSVDLHPHPLDWLHFENAFSIVYANNKSHPNDSARYLPFTPAPRLQSELRATAKRWKRFGNLFFKVQLQHYGQQNRVLLENRTETPTPAYTLWNTGFGFDWKGSGQSTVASLYFMVSNVFDQAYQNHLSRLKYAALNPVTGRTGVFNMGRNFSIKLVVPVFTRKK